MATDITKELAEALQSLLDEQNGAPLVQYEAEWNAAINKARAALASYRSQAEGDGFPPSEKLMALADRIDHENLWARAGIDRANFSPEQCDRLDAGVHLRRYADLMAPDAWRIFPPRPSAASFRAATLDRAVEMARREEERRAAPALPSPNGAAHSQPTGGANGS